jgi:hypothetical protein
MSIRISAPQSPGKIQKPPSGFEVVKLDNDRGNRDDHELVLFNVTK